MLRCISRLFKKKSTSPPINVNVVDEEYAIDFSLNWNLTYPVDRWWREKHQVAFNSPAHRVVSFWDMRFEFEEYLLFKRKRDAQDYKPNTGDWINVESLMLDDADLTEEEKLIKYKKEYESIDLDQYK